MIFVKSVYKCDDVLKRIEFELAKIGKKPSPAGIEMGLSKNSIANFKNSMPKADTLAIVADYLNVSVDYLLGRDHPAVPASAPAMDADTARMIMLFSQLSEKSRELLLHNAEMLAEIEQIDLSGGDVALA
jgi:transcriptional regulator with XRE-family HTH domain